MLLRVPVDLFARPVPHSSKGIISAVRTLNPLSFEDSKRVKNSSHSPMAQIRVHPPQTRVHLSNLAQALHARDTYFMPPYLVRCW